VQLTHLKTVQDDYEVKIPFLFSSFVFINPFVSKDFISELSFTSFWFTAAADLSAQPFNTSYLFVKKIEKKKV